MARRPRAAAAEVPHLVMQVARAGLSVFARDEDCSEWIDAVRESARRHGASLHGWSLLPHDAALLLTPATGPALAATVQAAGRRFGARFNARHGRRGPLWAGRFRSAPLDPQGWVLDALQWVETRAVAAGLVEEPLHHRWSTLVHHLGLRVDPTLREPDAVWALGNTPFDRQAAWQQRLQTPVPADRIRQLLAAMRSGVPLGSAEFVEGLAGRHGPSVSPRRRGRPRRAVGDPACPGT